MESHGSPKRKVNWRQVVIFSFLLFPVVLITASKLVSFFRFREATTFAQLEHVAILGELDWSELQSAAGEPDEEVSLKFVIDSPGIDIKFGKFDEKCTKIVVYYYDAEGSFFFDQSMFGDYFGLNAKGEVVAFGTYWW